LASTVKGITPNKLAARPSKTLRVLESLIATVSLLTSKVKQN
jgi:hypothetical protein